MVNPTDIEVTVSAPADQASGNEPTVTTFLFTRDQVHVTGPADLSPRTRAWYALPVPEMGLLPTYQRLAQLTQLEEDWDSYGAAPVSEGAINAARKFLSLISQDLFGTFGEGVRPYTVAPLADGGVKIDWRGQRSALELEIDPTGGLSSLLMRDHETGRTYEEHDNVSSQEAVDLVAQTLHS